MRAIKLLTFVAVFGLTMAVAGAAMPHPDVVIVNMVDISPTSFAFQPNSLTVRPGTVLRFRQMGMQPHNVQFVDAPPAAQLDGILMGPFLVQKGAVYELTIDDRFVPGDYEIVCTPHAALGMRATITVEK